MLYKKHSFSVTDSDTNFVRMLNYIYDFVSFLKRLYYYLSTKHRLDKYGKGVYGQTGASICLGWY